MWIITIIDATFSLALFINALLFIPQALKIFREKTSAAISLPTFSGFLLIQLAAVLYGMVHRDKVIAIGYLLSMATCGTVVLLTLHFKQKTPQNALNTGALQNGEHQKLETLEHILPIMPGNVYWVNKDNVYQGCNDNQAKASGLHSRFGIIGKKNRDLPWNIDAGTLPDDLDAMNTQVMERGQTMVIEEPATLSDGRRVIYLSSKVPLRDRNNAVIGMVGISVDITQLKETEKELTIQKEKAEQSEKAKTEFLRNMEHQIRTPFSGVFSIVQLLAESETDPEKKQYLDITYQSAKEFLELLNDIIDFSRTQTINTPIIEKKFDLEDLISRVISMDKAAALVKHLDLTYEYSKKMPKIFIGDSVRIQRLLLNLLSNAIKFTNQGFVKIVTKIAKQIDERHYIVQLIVSDSGIGIAPEIQGLIYEKFYRGHPANQNTYDGAGLGLSIVKQIIQELEGEIDVRSNVKKGTTFTCTLPMKRPLLDEVIIP